MRFGVVGMGRMGGGLATQALARGHSVVGFDVGGLARELVEGGVESAGSLQELVDRLTRPRFVLLYVPHGAITEKTVEDLNGLLGRGDILADGGNSHWRDSARRALAAGGRGVRYLPSADRARCA
jgi:6-phosphogluconate dehydrogenase